MLKNLNSSYAEINLNVIGLRDHFNVQYINDYRSLFVWCQIAIQKLLENLNLYVAKH